MKVYAKFMILEQNIAAYEYMKFLTNTENQIVWALETGYMPNRQSSIESNEYQSGDSIIAAVLEGATKNKNPSNELLGGFFDVNIKKARIMLQSNKQQ